MKKSGMDGIRRIDKKVSSICSETFDLASCEEYDDSDKELEQVRNKDQSVVQKLVSPPFIEGHQDMPDEGELKHLKKTFKGDTVELERKNSESIHLPTFDETLKHSQISHGFSGVLRLYQDHPEMERIGRYDQHVTSDDTLGLLSYEDILDMEEESKLASKYDNLQEDSMCEEYRNSTLRPVEPHISLPEDFLLPPGCINQIAPSPVAQQQLQQIVEQQSYHQQLRIPKLPTLASTQLSYSMSIQTPPSHIKPEQQNQLPQMGFVPQLMPASVEQAPKKLTDDEEIDEFVEIFTRKRFKLGLTQKQVSSSIKKLLGKTVTHEDINLFENLNLQRKYMHRIKLVLQCWLRCIDTSNSLRNLQTPLDKYCNTSGISDISRKFSNSADPVVKEPLEKEIVENPKHAGSSQANIRTSEIETLRQHTRQGT